MERPTAVDPAPLSARLSQGYGGPGPDRVFHPGCQPWVPAAERGTPSAKMGSYPQSGVPASGRWYAMF